MITPNANAAGVSLSTGPVPLDLPEPRKPDAGDALSYLNERHGLWPQAAKPLVRWGMLYRQFGPCTAVFVNPERTYAEIFRASSEPAREVRYTSPGAFWWFKPLGPGSDATEAYICESVLDAVSLYCLHLPRFFPGVNPDDIFVDNILYCAVGDASRQEAIDAIKAGMAAAGRGTVIALNNTDAGLAARARNAGCKSIAPHGTSWNEDLKASRTATWNRFAHRAV